MSDGQDSLERAAEVFEHACGLTGTARASYLQTACGGDAALRAEVESLLAAHDQQGEFLARPTQADTFDDAHLATSDTSVEQHSQVIGRYKLLQPIGEGGFGSVWMAEQKHPVKRRVALKIIKLGMDTKQVIARFEAERQALAMMDHPNIAKVLDAGATDAGRPYFVMEYIKGVPILEYCDTRRLDTGARLDLFIKVCHAIQHAHQKGIIHRDIKPTNILVTLHDGEPVPKVIDFGIAKATNAELTEKTLFTQHRQMIGTPAYMSPEQAEMSGLDIDTRSDIYSLGVLLYELLTGTTPFDSKSLAEAGFAEMMRIIRDTEPHKPSTRLSSLGETGPRTSELRQTDLHRLSLILRGDLDWIVMKCLEKDRARRYETASGLADDIQRHLSDQPVLAGPPSSTYRLRKFVKRNRGPVLAGGSFTALLLIAVVTLFFLHRWAMSEWQRAEAFAIAEREHNSRALVAMTQMLSESGVFDTNGILVGEVARLDPATSDEVYFEVTRRADGPDLVIPRWIDESRDDDPNAIAVELLASEAVHWTREGMESARSRADLLQRVSDFQMQMLDGVEPVDMGGAILDELTRQVHSRIESTWVTAEDGSTRPPTPGEVQDAMSRYHDAVRPANAADIARYTLDVSVLTPAMETLEREYADAPDLQASLYATLGTIYHSLGHFERAEEATRHALQLRREHDPEQPVLAETLTTYAFLLQVQGRYEEAREPLDEAYRIYRNAEGPDSQNVARMLRRRGSLANSLGEPDEAERLARKSLEISRRHEGENGTGARAAYWVIATAHGNRGQFEQAAELFKSLQTMTEAALGADSRTVLTVKFNRVEALHAAGTLEEAERLSTEVLDARQSLLGAQHPGTAFSLLQLARLKRDLGRLDQAESLMREGLAIRLDTYGDENSLTLVAMRDLADVLRSTGQDTEARVLEDRAIAAARILHGPSHPKTLSTLHATAIASASAAEHERAAQLGRAAWAGYHQQFGRDDEDTQDVITFLAELHDERHRIEPEAGHDQVAAHWRTHLSAPDLSADPKDDD